MVLLCGYMVICVQFLEELWYSPCFLERYLLHVWWSLYIYDISHSLTRTVCLSSILDRCVMLDLCSVFNYYVYEMFVTFVCWNTSIFHFSSLPWNRNAMAYICVSSDAHCSPSHPNVPRGHHWSLFVFCSLSVSFCVIVFVIMWFPAFGNTTV